MGLAEELGFRGYVLQTLGERMPLWAAAGLSAAIFALYHLTLGGCGPGFAIVAICFAAWTWMGAGLPHDAGQGCSHLRTATMAPIRAAEAPAPAASRTHGA